MLIRPTTTRDAHQLQPLFNQLGYPAGPDAIARRLARISGQQDYAAWVAQTDRGAISGFAGGHLIMPFENDEPAAQLLALVVDEQARGQGIGRALVAECERWAMQHGAHRLTLNSSTKRKAAHAFYEQMGFTSTGLRFVKKVTDTRTESGSVLQED
ncbi:GNAT family N-acetyltransferase [Natronoglycomyces albus]|uniref:GNAT family N-acetyltransferase n=1 Tax=Natronoglycomyces albus TaxID=2811108 RepID=A0A895XS78_9ACTN|nr:GNAT family N-acetyltransferase [Natronoglycomyces albus]QSB04488.1 GNAT family N-acetyltransferase [Natronoglycomyces albus]